MPSILSSRAALSSRSTPGKTPPRPQVGRRNFRRRRDGCRRASDSRSESSITAVNVVPRSAARFLASRRSWSSSRIVVLMHQSISARHQYVKDAGSGSV